MFDRNFNHHKTVWTTTGINKSYERLGGIPSWRMEQLSSEGRHVNYSDQCERAVVGALLELGLIGNARLNNLPTRK